MYIEKRIKLNQNYYYIRLELEYQINQNISCLRLKNWKDNYWDNGDFSLYIKEIEKNIQLK